MSMEAKSAAARLLDDEMAEIRVLGADNEIVSIRIPQVALYSLGRRIADLCDPRDWIED